MGYKLPSDTDVVSSSWWDHKSRNPPSAEAGTDYAAAYGSPLYASAAGRVVDVSHSNGGGTGRYIAVDLYDGRRTRSLHLSEVWVSEGQEVGWGQTIGLTGASGHGSDWGYGAHVHQTLFPSHSYDFDNTLDFALYVIPDEPPPPPAPPERKQTMRLARNTNDEGGSVRFYTEAGYTFVQNPADRDLLAHFINDDVVPFGPDGGADVRVFNNLQLDIIARYIADTQSKPAAGGAGALVTPAWVAGGFLGLIGLVEVIRFIVDLIV